MNTDAATPLGHDNTATAVGTSEVTTTPDHSNKSIPTYPSTHDKGSTSVEPTIKASPTDKRTTTLEDTGKSVIKAGTDNSATAGTKSNKVTPTNSATPDNSATIKGTTNQAAPTDIIAASTATPDNSATRESSENRATREDPKNGAIPTGRSENR